MISENNPLENDPKIAQETERPRSIESGNESFEDQVETDEDLEHLGEKVVNAAQEELLALNVEGARGVDNANSSVRLSPEQFENFRKDADQSIGEIASSGKSALDDLEKELTDLLSGESGLSREEKRKRISEIGEEVGRLEEEQESQLAQKEAAFKQEMDAREAAHREKMGSLKKDDENSIAMAEKEAQAIVDNDPEVQALKAELARIKASDEAAEAAHQAEMENMKQQSDELIASLKKENNVSEAGAEVISPGGDRESQIIVEALKAKMAERSGEAPKLTQQEMIDRMLGKNKTEQPVSKPSGNPEADRLMADFEAKMAEQKAKDKERMAVHEANMDAMVERTNELSRLSQELEANSAALDDAVRKNQEAAREASSPTTEVERSCQKCGGKTRGNGSAFCSECGNKLEQITPEMIQKQYQENISKLQQSYEEVLRAQQNYDRSSQNLKKLLEEQTTQKAA